MNYKEAVLEKLDSVLENQLRFLRNEIAYLKQEQQEVSSLHVYTNSGRIRRAVERSLQVSVELCLDIGRRIIARNGYDYPDSNRQVFEILVREGVVSSGLLPALQKMAGFRNIVVHEYVRIDDAQVYGMLKSNLGDFEAFAAGVVDFLAVDETQGDA